MRFPALVGPMVPTGVSSLVAATAGFKQPVERLVLNDRRGMFSVSYL